VHRATRFDTWDQSAVTRQAAVLYVRSVRPVHSDVSDKGIGMEGIAAIIGLLFSSLLFKNWRIKIQLSFHPLFCMGQKLGLSH
jgi:hypothetical protein